MGNITMNILGINKLPLDTEIADDDTIPFFDKSLRAEKRIAKSNLSVNYIWSAPVTLTNAQIKALPTTAVQIAAAPGANRIIVTPAYSIGAKSLALTFNWVADYTNIDAGARLKVQLGTDEYVEFAESSFFAWGESAFWSPGNIEEIVASGTYGPNSLTSVTNQALFLSVNNAAAGDFTGGHASNTIIASPAYCVYDTTTGLFVPAET